MKKLLAVLSLSCLLLQPLASQELSISLEELMYLLQLSGNSKILDENLDVLLEGFKTSQKSGDILLTDYDTTVMSLSESVTLFETNNTDATNISEDLNNTVTTVVKTIDELKPPFWKSPLGTGLKILGIVLISAGTGYLIGKSN